MKNPEIKYITKTPSSYYIALAAWRRGLHVTFIKNIHNYRITSTEKSLFFATSAMVGGREGLSSHYTCKDKYATKHLLQKNNVPTPEGKLFDQDRKSTRLNSSHVAISYAVFCLKKKKKTKKLQHSEQKDNTIIKSICC